MSKKINLKHLIMKTIRVVLMIALVAIFSQFSMAQNKEGRAKANIEKLNQKIISKNPDAALTEDQRAQLLVINLEQINALEAIKVQYTDEEVIKAKNKEVYQKQFPKTNSVLTADQKLALKTEK